MFFETTIMGNTADLAMVQKTIIDTSTKRVSHRGSLLKGVAVQGVLYQSILNTNLTGRKKLDRKRCTSNRDDRRQHLGALHEEWTEDGVHQESQRSDIFRKRATKPLLNQKQHQKHLTWAKEKKTGLLVSRPKPSFQIKVNCGFHLEIKVPESGGREERNKIHVAWSPVWSFHSQWWFGLPCHLLVLVHCVFRSPQSTQPSTRTF